MIKAVIVDDERKARETLDRLVSMYCKEVEVVGLAEDIESAYKLINDKNPDLIFLDVEMPGGTGMHLLDKFEHIPFKVIFTTAYDHYAVKAIKYQAFDYLLKPIDVQELQDAIKKLVALPLAEITTQSANTNTTVAKTATQNLTLNIAVKDGFLFLKPEEIIRAEADGSYTTIYMIDGQRHVVSKNLKEIEESLNFNVFFRTHNSHLINIKFVKKLSRIDGLFAEMQDGVNVEISRRRKDDFLKAMGIE